MLGGILLEFYAGIKIMSRYIRSNVRRAAHTIQFTSQYAS